MAENLRDPILYPHWVWLLSAFLILVAIAVAAGLLLAYRYSVTRERVDLHPLSEVRRARYFRQIDEVQGDVEAGRLSARQAHLALSAIIRASASEILRYDVESLTVQDAQVTFPQWPELVGALAWCETPSFGTSEAEGEARIQQVAGGISYARQVVSR